MLDSVSRMDVHQTILTGPTRRDTQFHERLSSEDGGAVTMFTIQSLSTQDKQGAIAVQSVPSGGWGWQVRTHASPYITH